jgi:hypothetical protein
MDPEAAQIVLASGLRPVLAGLDVCHRTHLTRRQLAATGLTTDLGRFVQRACAAWLPADGDAGPHSARTASTTRLATGVDAAGFDVLFSERLLSRL